MKKLLSVILTTTISTALVGTTPIFASEDISVEVDGKVIKFDVNPEIIDGRTMVPLRKIFEEIGALVKWDSETKTVTARKNKKTVTLSVDSADLQIDKGKTDDEGNPVIETVTLEVPAQIVSDRTLVPARAISESFGFNVEWDENNKKVVITSDDKEDDTWKENVGSINLTELTYEGEGVEITDNQIKITDGGDFTISGKLADGNIIISAKEKVKLRLSGVEITSENNPCIFVEDADKAYITLTDGTENRLLAKNSDDGAIYSKENLEIKGDGSLYIESLAGHGIKASDNLNIENGNITINASSDGIHINDTFKMIGGELDITAVGDGIDSESIVNISSGKITVETNGTPVETTQPENSETQGNQRRFMWADEADVEFEKSTKGINAEWMMRISGGDININSASHAIHCQDEIEISGGNFVLSSKYDKGISAHGNLTIGNSETTIDVIKSTEGIESKKVMTVNDGVIKVVSSDDAINATGGNSGMMMPGGNFGGAGRENTPPEGFEMRPREEGTNETNERPGRGGKGPFGGKRPETENQTEGKFTSPAANSENGEFTPPFTNSENGEFMPPFMNSENGEFMPFFENGKNMEFRPSFNNDENQEFKPPFEVDENGNFIMNFENREFTLPEGTEPPMNGGRFGGGNMGGFGRNAKTCLIINGGYLELSGNDDCVDANGTMIINGGTIKANNPTGSFSGNFGVLDADGQITIGEDANIILASSNGNENSLKIQQNSIIIYCENQYEAKEEIIISDKNGNVVYEYAPEGAFKTVLVASNKIESGEKYTIKIGNETFEAEISQQITVVGTKPSGGMGFGRGPGMR